MILDTPTVLFSNSFSFDLIFKPNSEPKCLRVQHVSSHHRVSGLISISCSCAIVFIQQLSSGDGVSAAYRWTEYTLMWTTLNGPALNSTQSVVGRSWKSEYEFRQSIFFFFSPSVGSSSQSTESATVWTRKEFFWNSATRVKDFVAWLSFLDLFIAANIFVTNAVNRHKTGAYGGKGDSFWVWIII